MMKTLVYGLGKFFHDNKERILNEYNVVAFCDQDEEKWTSMSGGVSRDYLSRHVEDYDEVLVCADPMSIISDLIGNLGIPQNKIKIYAYERFMIQEEIMPFWGQNNEDAALLLLVQLMGMKCSDLHYLEIGTNNPVNGNNSYTLYRCGARGVLVDAVPYFKYLIEMFRPGDIFIQAAVLDTGSELKKAFYLPNKSDGTHDFGIASLDKDWSGKFPGIAGTTVIDVPAININDLFTKIDFLPDILLIDAEGYDIKILQSVDYSRFKPAIIVAELGIPSQSFRDFMDRNGYQIFSIISACNTIFVLKEKWENKEQNNA